MDRREFSHELDVLEICTAILMGIFTASLADGWTDRTDDRHTDRQRWNLVWVDRRMSHAADIWMDLSCTDDMTDGHIWGFT